MIYKSITLRIHDIFTRNTCHGRQVKLFHFSKIPTHQAFSEGILKQMLSFRPLHSLSYSPIWLKSTPPPSPTFPTFHRCYQNPPFNRQRFDFQFFDIPTYASLGGGEEGGWFILCGQQPICIWNGGGNRRRQSWKTGHWHQTLISTWPVKLRTVPFGAL